jgi:hypothetical protein
VRNSSVKLISLAVVVTGLPGCQTISSGADQPAIISSANDASRADLQRAVNSALNTDVALAADALTDTDILIIERSQAQRIGGLPADGRMMDLPVQFRLVLRDGDCVLIDQRNNSRYALPGTTCNPIKLSTDT